jgi:hypothetical protein
MASNQSGSTRSGAAATTAAMLVLLVVAGLGNQGLQNWRTNQANSGNSWTSDIMSLLLPTGWRFTALSGPEHTQHWLAPLVFNVVFVVFTLLFALGAAAGGGRVRVLFGVWGATTLAGGLAAIASTNLAYQGVAVKTADAYRELTGDGLALGLLVGVAAGILAALVVRNGEPGTLYAEPDRLARTLDQTQDWPITG